MLEHLALHLNTHFQCGAALSGREYAQIFAFAISYALAYIYKSHI